MYRIGPIRSALTALLALASAAAAGDVTGIVQMPATCSPAVSPAVVWLEANTSKQLVAEDNARLSLVRQKDLRFQPRVLALALGGRLQFTNDDQEPHNVHVTGPGVNLNQTIRPGETVDIGPTKPGLLRIVCDIHIHMRAYVMVVSNAHFAVCDRDGRFRIAGVPPGDYSLHIWHEFGPPSQSKVIVGPAALDTGIHELQSAAVANAATLGEASPLDWSDVLDRVSLHCSLALDTASRKAPDAAAKAVAQVDDAYLGVFEASDMEIAVGSLLGYDRVIAIESRFRALRRLAREVAQNNATATRFSTAQRQLMSDLVAAARDLQTRGVTNKSTLASTSGSRAPAPIAASASGDQTSMLLDLRRSLDRIAAFVEQQDTAEASAQVGTTYFEAFEPIERMLATRNPASVRPLEARFAILRGRVDAGLKGAALDDTLDQLHSDVTTALGTAPGGGNTTFGVMAIAAFATILREGVEILLLLTILGALVTKAGNPCGARQALWLGVAFAIVASLLTALALNALLASSRNQVRELIEGAVMLLAAGVLFYVSYWLIAQSESKRWINFLRSAAARGSTTGRFTALGLAAFLAVYREGAEIVLMYQGLLSGQSPSGIAGIVAGTLAGLAALGVFAFVLRATTLHLPMTLFFQATGVLLFALAVVFAGNGVLELQTAQVLKVTEVPRIGAGIPLLGVHPTLQGLAVQGIMLLGALVALGYLGSQNLRRRGSERPPATHTTTAPVPAEATV